ncbi:Uma2 family endonuclease [Aureimonas psammosilenae]|uniref:Uma2 family endonuclease n=1 Tax=Aureimonas psammosilenae TaxID=2495496 RepID=UPI001260D41A|nr:Uma2 family endonuclease [Aureimonas psammosilenae]
MSALPRSRRATYADLEAVPPHLVAEIVEGSLITHPRPAPKHAVASSALGITIGSPFDRGRDGPGGWIILDEPELHLGDDVVVPDLAGWRRERMPVLPDTAYFETAPDWICEVVSPSTEAYDRGVKRAVYAKAGVVHFWILDPRAEILETFSLRDGGWFLTGTFSGTDHVSVAPFDAISFPLAELWPFSQPTGPVEASASADTTTDT